MIGRRRIGVAALGKTTAVLTRELRLLLLLATEMLLEHRHAARASMADGCRELREKGDERGGGIGR
jgi:hypothetical protein